MYKVVYMVNDTKERIDKEFSSYYDYYCWYQKASRSTAITILRHPNT